MRTENLHKQIRKWKNRTGKMETNQNNNNRTNEMKSDEEKENFFFCRMTIRFLVEG